MKRYIIISIAIIIAGCIHANPGTIVKTDSVPLKKTRVDYVDSIIGASALDQYNVVWKIPSRNSMESMPVGGGDIGCNVWVEKGDLLFYVQRSGSFNELGEYVKLGRVRVTLYPNPFENAETFSQALILKDGHVVISAKGKDGDVSIRLWVDIFTHSVHVTIDSDRPIDYTAAYETWRDKDRLLEEVMDEKTGRLVDKLKNSARWGSYNFMGYAGEVKKLKDIFRHEGNEVFFYHRNPEDPVSPAYGIKQQGLSKYKDEIYNGNKNLTFGGRLFAENAIAAGTGEGRYFNTNFKSVVLKSKVPSTTHHLMMATHIAQKERLSDWEHELDTICREVKTSKGNLQKNIGWWKAFWDRSWIVVSPENKDNSDAVWKMGRNYQLGRYQFGCNFYGDSPTKFNGGSFTVDPFNNEQDPDWRCWGGDFYTAQNQRLIYWPMLKAGDFEAMKPQFELYYRGLKGAICRVKEHFGHEGAMYGENTNASGTFLPFAYGWESNDRSPLRRIRPQEIPFGDPRIDGINPMYSEPGIMHNIGMGYHFLSQVEHAYMMLEYHRFSDQNIDRYMPFIKQSLVFLDQHYQKRQMLRNGKPFDKNGKLFFHPSQAGEKYRKVQNPVDLVSGIKACLEALIELNSAAVTEADRTYYREYLSRLPESTPLDIIDGKTVVTVGGKYFKRSGQKKPSEAPQFYPLFPFNRYSLSDQEIEYFRNTWNLDENIDKSKIKGWQQLGIFMARMGLVEECLEFHKIKLADAEKCKFPSFLGVAYDWVPDHNWLGAGMIGLQEMLLQTVGDEIRVLPAWDMNIDVDFKLHAPKQTTVKGSVRNGKLVDLVVIPKARRKDVILLPSASILTESINRKIW